MHRVRMRFEQAKMALDTSLFKHLDDEDDVPCKALSLQQRQEGKGEDDGEEEEEDPSTTAHDTTQEKKTVDCIGGLSSPLPLPPPPSPTREKVASGTVMVTLTCVDSYAPCPFCDRPFGVDTTASADPHAANLFEDEYPAATHIGALYTGDDPVLNMLPDYVYMVL